MNKICLYNYVSNLNPQAAYDLLKKEGYGSMPRNKETMAQGLADMVKKEGNVGLAKIIAIHPDKELLTTIQQPEPMKSCDGCDKMKSADAETGKKFRLTDNQITVIIVCSTAALIFTSLALILRKVK
jgi:hypothetical protein